MRRLLHARFAILLALLIAAPAHARIIKTRRPQPVHPGLGLVVGSGFEYQSDGDEQEYGFPFLLEWAVTPRLQLTVEPVHITITSKRGPSIRGFDDLETALSLDVWSERRRRPAVSIEGGVKWPTATDSSIGTGVTEFSLGLLLSKDLILTELGLNVVYAQVGVPRTGLVQNTVQISASSEWPLGPDLSLTSELLTTQGVGRRRGTALDPSAPAGSGFNVPGGGMGEWEATLGIARSFGRRLKAEPGFILQTDGTWQAVFAWEWDFGDGR